MLEQDGQVKHAVLVAVIAEAVERQLDFRRGFSQLLAFPQVLDFVHLRDGLDIRFGCLGQRLGNERVELLCVLQHEVQHLFQFQRVVPAGLGQRLDVRRSRLVHRMQDAGLLEGRHACGEPEGVLHFLGHAQPFDVLLVALVEVVAGFVDGRSVHALVDFVTHVAPFITGAVPHVLPDRADALGHGRVGDAAQGGDAGGRVERGDEVEQVLVLDGHCSNSSWLLCVRKFGEVVFDCRFAEQGPGAIQDFVPCFRVAVACYPALFDCVECFGHGVYSS